MAKKRLVLHGWLKEACPHDVVLDADTVAEAINGLCKMTKAFNPKIGRPRVMIEALGFDTVEALYTPTEQEEIHIVPALYGGLGGGIFKIVVGTVLVVAGLAVMTFNPTIGTVLVSMGASYILGGVLELLSPAPNLDLDGGADIEASKYLGAPGNTVKIGTRIPLLYGEHIAYGHFLSFNVDAKDVAV